MREPHPVQPGSLEGGIPEPPLLPRAPNPAMVPRLRLSSADLGLSQVLDLRLGANYIITHPFAASRTDFMIRRAAAGCKGFAIQGLALRLFAFRVPTVVF